MQAIEFETKIENGAVTISSQYQEAFGDNIQVRVILLKPETPTEKEHHAEEGGDIIAEMLEHPLEVDQSPSN